MAVLVLLACGFVVVLVLLVVALPVVTGVLEMLAISSMCIWLCNSASAFGFVLMLVLLVLLLACGFSCGYRGLTLQVWALLWLLLWLGGEVISSPNYF